MKHSLRLYSCTLCHSQVTICSCCDRGQIYCASSCSSIARKESCKEANQRYQKTQKGKLNNALRQRRFRQRLKNLVTDQGTHATQQHALLQTVENESTKSVIKHNGISIKCSFCQKDASNYARTVFLHQIRRKKSHDLHIYSRPP